MPNLSTTAKTKTKKAPRRKLPATFALRCAVKKSSTVRTQFHNMPVDLPPPLLDLYM